MMPLRGFLNCSKCTRTLTSSASKGRNAYYYYYHCTSSCGYRTKADIVNDLFVSELKEYVLNDVSALHFKTAILDSFEALTKHDRINKSKYIVEITELNKRITQGRELLLSGDIDGPDYKIIKSDAEQKIAVLEAKLSEIPIDLIEIHELEEILDRAISKFTKLDVIYWNSSSEVKRQIIGSMFPEKFTFENLLHRTAKVSFLFQLIYQINRNLGCKKKKGKSEKICLPSLAPEAGLEPATL